MPPDERRAAILAATVPLLRERGDRVSTKDLAEAAGVAEGTLYRVFPDKRALLCAALDEAMDIGPLARDLGRIDPAAVLEERIRLALELMTARLEGVVQLMTALHGLARAEPGESGRPPGHWPPRNPAERSAPLLAALVEILEPDRAALRVTPLQAAGLLLDVALGNRMPGRPDGARLLPADVAACLVRGLAIRPEPSRAPSSSARRATAGHERDL